MAEFLVKMADERGHLIEQVEVASTATELRERFAQQGYLVTDVRPRGLLSVGKVRVPRRRKVNKEQFVIFNQQFVTLIKAGLPILTSLDLLARMQRNQYFRGVLQDVRNRVKEGELLSHAFEAQHVSSKVYTTTLLAGERSGNLEEVLSRYVAFERVSITFRKKLLASLVYPALLTVMMIILLSVLLVYVVPRFADLYSEVGNAQLPPITLFLLSVGQTLQSHIVLILAGIAIAVFLFVQWSKTEQGGSRIDQWRLGAPLLGRIWLKYQVAMFARTLSTLLQGGLPLVTALDTAADSMESRVLGSAVRESSSKVKEGRSLARSLEEGQIMPELAIEMVEVGESTGSLPAMLGSVGEFYEEDVQTSLAASLSLIEPAILVIMGSVVAFVLLSLYMPIFSLGAAAGVR